MCSCTCTLTPTGGVAWLYPWQPNGALKGLRSVLLRRCVVVHFTFHQSSASSAIVSRRSTVLSGLRSIRNGRSSNATCTLSPAVWRRPRTPTRGRLTSFDKRFVQVGSMIAAKLCNVFPSGGARRSSENAAFVRSLGRAKRWARLD